MTLGFKPFTRYCYCYQFLVSFCLHCLLDKCFIIIIIFRSLFFGDYMNPDSPERIYDEVTDLSQLTLQMEGWVSHLLHSAQRLSSYCYVYSNFSKKAIKAT